MKSVRESSSASGRPLRPWEAQRARSLGQRPRGNEPEELGLSVATVNANAWATAKKWIEENLHIHVYFIQEHKLGTEEEIAEASQWALRKGLASAWSPGKWLKAGISGGTAILA
eukprot:7193303-Lingulodinium_polyedra.AAC.1